MHVSFSRFRVISSPSLNDVLLIILVSWRTWFLVFRSTFWWWFSCLPRALPYMLRYPCELVGKYGYLSWLCTIIRLNCQRFVVHRKLHKQWICLRLRTCPFPFLRQVSRSISTTPSLEHWRRILGWEYALASRLSLWCWECTSSWLSPIRGVGKTVSIFPMIVNGPFTITGTCLLGFVRTSFCSSSWRFDWVDPRPCSSRGISQPLPVSHATFDTFVCQRWRHTG